MDTSSIKNCTREFYNSHKTGRSKKKKSPGAAAKQAFAACKTAMKEGKSFSFINYLTETENGS